MNEVYLVVFSKEYCDSKMNEVYSEKVNVKEIYANRRDAIKTAMLKNFVLEREDCCFEQFYNSVSYLITKARHHTKVLMGNEDKGISGRYSVRAIKVNQSEKRTPLLMAKEDLFKIKKVPEGTVNFAF